MVSVVIYGIIAIALAAAAGYALLVFSSTTQQTTQTQENSVRLDQAANALRASLLALNNDGTLFAPMGYNPGTTGSYTQLPLSLAVVGSSPWGAPFLYCPVSIESALTGATGYQAGVVVTSPPPTSATYSVGTYSSPATLNTPYVVNAPSSGSLPAGIRTAGASGYVAFIVSSLGPNQAVPSCSDITITSTGVTVTHGSVRGVTAGFPFNQRVIASTDRTEIYVGTAVSGDSTGRDFNNVTTLPNAIAMWQALQPRLTDIYLTGGTTYTGANALGSDLGLAASSRPVTNEALAELPTLVFASYGAQSTLAISILQNIKTPVSFVNLSITMQAAGGITTFAPLKFINSSYTYSGTIAPIYIFNSNFVSWDSNFANTDLQIYHGSSALMFTDGANSSTLANSRVYVDNSKVTFYNSGTGYTSISSSTSSYQPLVMINATGELSYNSTLYLTSSVGSAFTIVDGGSFNLESGSHLSISTSTITSDGVYLEGGRLVNNGATLTISNSAPAPFYGVFSDTDGIYDMLAGTLTTSGTVNASVYVNPGGKLNISTGTINRAGASYCFGLGSDLPPYNTIWVSPVSAYNGVYPAANNGLYLPYYPGSPNTPAATTFSVSLADVTGTVTGTTADIPWASLAPAIQSYVNNMLTGSAAIGTGEMLSKNIALYNFTCN